MSSALRYLAAVADHPVTAWIGVGALAFTVALTVMGPIANSDVGWHLALGRTVVESGSVPDSDPFTHTAAGAPMVAHEWLSQVAYHGIVERGGVLALRSFHAGLAGGLLLLLFVWLRRSGVTPALALLGTVAYAALVQARFQIRPHMLHLLFFMAMYGYLFVVKPRLTGPQLAAIFAVVVVWANAHSGVLLLPALLALYTAIEAIQQRAGWRLPEPSDLGGGRLGRLGGLTAGVAAACLVTPNHVRLLPYLAESRRINSGLSMEWFPITRFWDQRESLLYSVETFWILAIATVLVAVAVVGRRSASEIAVVLALAWLPFSAQRFTTVYFAPLIFVLGEVTSWLGAERRGSPRPQRAVAVGAVVLCVAVADPVLLSHQSADWTRNLTAVRNFRRDLFPVQAVTFLGAVGFESRLYHPGRWGGYLLMREGERFPVFSDGRWVTLGEQIIRHSAAIERRGPRAFELLDAYAVDLLLVPRGWMTPEIAEERGWLPIFENFNAGLYLRRGPSARPDLHRVQAYYAGVGIPFDPKRGFDERVAARANPDWASRFHVQRMHLNQFRASAFDLGAYGGTREQGW